jgi:hypothetical protein
MVRNTDSVLKVGDRTESSRTQPPQIARNPVGLAVAFFRSINFKIVLVQLGDTLLSAFDFND